MAAGGSGNSQSKRGSSTSFPRLLGLAAGVAIVIVLVISLLSPPAEDDEDPADASTPAVGDVTTSPLVPRSDLALPEQAEPLDIEAVSQELTQLATDLVTSYSDDAEAWYVAGLAHTETQQSARAVEVLQRAIELLTRQPSAYVCLAKNLKLAGRDEEAVTALRQAQERGMRSPDIVQGLAESLANLGQLAEATAVLEEGTRDFPEQARLWLALGQTQIQLQRFADAELSLRRAIELGAEGVAPRVALSTALARQGQADEALRVRKELAELTRRHDQRVATSGQGFQEVYGEQFRHNTVLVLHAAAQVFSQHGATDRSLTLLHRAIQLDPRHVDSLELLAGVYRREGRLPDVLVVLERLTSLQPETAIHVVNLASVAAQLGDADMAETALRRAVERDPDNGMAHWALAALYMSQQRAGEAVEPAEVAAERLRTAEAYLLLVDAYRTLGRLPEARETLRKARQVHPRDPRLSQLEL